MISSLTGRSNFTQSRLSFNIISRDYLGLIGSLV